MGFITRNLKRKGVKIGIILILIGICSGSFAYWNAKPNINNMTMDDVPVVAECIDGIGKETLKSVVENQPYEDMAELKQVINVGEKRYKILKHHFDTHDICRIEHFWISLFLMIVLIAFSANLMVHVINKQHNNTGDYFSAIISAIKNEKNNEPDTEEHKGKRFKRK